jgi:hypothetical protein
VINPFLPGECRWNSWNFFACNINETVIRETGSTAGYISSFLVVKSAIPLL